MMMMHLEILRENQTKFASMEIGESFQLKKNGKSDSTLFSKVLNDSGKYKIALFFVSAEPIVNQINENFAFNFSLVEDRKKRNASAF